MVISKEIFCPKCGAKYDPYDDDIGLVTYHGDDPAVCVTCGTCDFDFYVKEIVDRFFGYSRKIGGRGEQDD